MKIEINSSLSTWFPSCILVLWLLIRCITWGDVLIWSATETIECIENIEFAGEWMLVNRIHHHSWSLLTIYENFKMMNSNVDFCFRNPYESICMLFFSFSFTDGRTEMLRNIPLQNIDEMQWNLLSVFCLFADNYDEHNLMN